MRRNAAAAAGVVHARFFALFLLGPSALLIEALVTNSQRGSSRSISATAASSFRRSINEPNDAEAIRWQVSAACLSLLVDYGYRSM
jgi:hypothetical protein